MIADIHGETLLRNLVVAHFQLPEQDVKVWRKRDDQFERDVVVVRIFGDRDQEFIYDDQRRKSSHPLNCDRDAVLRAASRLLGLSS